VDERMQRRGDRDLVAGVSGILNEFLA